MAMNWFSIFEPMVLMPFDSIYVSYSGYEERFTSFSVLIFSVLEGQTLVVKNQPGFGTKERKRKHHLILQ